MSNTNGNGVRYNVVASCMTYAGAKAESIRFPRKPISDDEARAIFGAMPFVTPADANPQTAWALSLTLVKWTDAGRQVIAERN